MNRPTNSLERGLMVLELVARRSGGLTNAEIARYFGIATSTCSYILGRLESHGYLKREKETGRYEVGIKIAGLAHSVPKDTTPIPCLLPILQSLVEETRLTAAVGVLRQGRVVLVAHVDTPEPLKVNLGTGSEVNFDASALGKALVAWLPPEEVSALVEQFGFSKKNSRDNSRQETSALRFAEELQLVRSQGFAINNSVPGVRSVAAPVAVAEGKACAAVVATGATSQPIWKHPRELTERLKTAAGEISKKARLVDWQHLP